jgi:Fe-S cluster assembly scaffold protein SufB
MKTQYALRHTSASFLLIQNDYSELKSTASMLYYFKIVPVTRNKKIMIEEVFRETENALWTTIIFLVSARAELIYRTLILAQSSVYLTIRVTLLAHQAHATVEGKIIGSHGARINLYTIQKHQAKNSTSMVKISGIATNQTRITHRGMIKITKAGKNSDAAQHSRHIALTDDARLFVEPALEVAQNEVRCTHGSATGMLDDESLIFLQLRGIDQKTAYNLLLMPFISFSASTELNPIAHAALAELLERVDV